MSDGTSGSILGMTALPVPSVGFSLGTNICHFFSFFFSMCTYLHHLCCLFNWQRWMLGEKKKKKSNNLLAELRPKPQPSRFPPQLPLLLGTCSPINHSHAH